MTVSITVLTVAVFAIEPAAEWLQFDRDRVAEVWRWVGGHITHFGACHMFWDVVMFAVLGFSLEPRGRGRFVCCLAVTAVAIPLTVLLSLPEIRTYRGLSGLDSALFTMCITTFGRDAYRRRDLGLLLTLGALASLFCAKLGYEFVAERNVFVDSADFAPLPLVHVVGAVVGVLCGVFPGCALERPATCSGPS